MHLPKIFSTFKTFLTFILLLNLLFFTAGFAAKCSSDEKPKKSKKSKKSKKKSNKLVLKSSSKKTGSNSKKKKDDQEDENSEKELDEPEDEKKEKKKEKEKEPEEKGKKKKTKKKKKKIKKGGSPDKIWKDLIGGNKRFVAGKHSNGKFISVRKKLVEGQHPEVIVLGCADSRVPPELVFDKNLGELFVIRTAGNIADPIALGSIEYAAEHLHSKLLVVLGHESCGAVGAALSKEKMPTAGLRAIVKTIRPAFKSEDICKIGNDNNIKCVELNAVHSAKNIVKKSPILKKLVAKGELSVIKAIYKLESGKVEKID